MGSKALADAARTYLSAGLTIIALTGKLPNTLFHPNGKDSPMVGVPEEAKDDALIDQVFTHPTTSGIGIVLHPFMVVVDIDGEEGVNELAEILDMDGPQMVDWAKHLDTPVAGTGRGLHIYYLSTHPWGTVKLGTKLDLKGFGGYVVAPPSIHPVTMKSYEWGVGRELVDEESGQRVHIGLLPDALEERLVTREKLLEDKRMEHAIRYERVPIIVDGRIVALRSEKVQVPLEVLADRLAAEPVDSGNGNRLLHWCACIAAEDGYALHAALDAFLPVVTATWAQPMDARTARATIRSGYKTVAKGGA